jgi:hypothetical protein
MSYPVKVTAFIYQGELDYISRCVLDYPEIETGGDLFGFWTHTGSPVIQYVIGPGKQANHQQAFFNQELEYLSEYGQILRAGHSLQHIGQWHSHHQLGLAEPSQHDISTVCTGINQYRLNQFFLVIANIRQQSSTVNGFLFRSAQNRQFDYAGWEVMDGESPIRKQVDAAYPNLAYQPVTGAAAISNLTAPQLVSNSTYALNYNTGDWLSNKANHIILKQIIDSLAGDFERVEVFMNPPDNNLYLEIKGAKGIYRLYLVNNYPDTKPVVQFCYKGIYKQVNSDLAEWALTLDVAERTVAFMHHLAAQKIRKKHLLNITFNNDK